MAKKLVLLMVLVLWAGAVCFGDASAQLDQAEQLAEQGKFVAAEAVYEQIVAETGASDAGLSAQEGLTILYVKQGKDAEAAAALQGLVENFGAGEAVAKAVDHVADEYRQQKKYGSALEIYRYMVETWPEADHAAESQRAVALSYLLLGDEPNAAAATEKLLTEFGECATIAKAVDHLADDLRELGEYGRARDLYATVPDRWPDAPHAVNCAAGVVRASILLGDDPNAEGAFSELLAEFGGSEGAAKAVDNIADEYRKLGRYAEAREIYNTMLDRWPDSNRRVESQKGAVLCSIAMRDEPNAAAGVDRLVADFSTSPDLATALRDVAKAYEKAKQYQAAQGVYERAGQVFSDDDRVRWASMNLAKGQIYNLIRDGNAAVASAALDRLVADFNDHADFGAALFEVGREWFYTRRYEQAIEVWELMQNEYPAKHLVSQIPYLLATCHKRLGRKDTAIEYYKMSLEKYPDARYSYRIPYRLGLEYREGKDPEQALYWLRKQSQLYSNQLLAQRASFEQVAVHYWELKDYDKTIELAQQYLTEYPDDEHTWAASYLMARSYDDKGNNAEAVAILERALKKFAGTKRETQVTEQLARIKEGGDK
jgi:tetratricopeptide (TPR) repeat protein